MKFSLLLSTRSFFYYKTVYIPLFHCSAENEIWWISVNGQIYRRVDGNNFPERFITIVFLNSLLTTWPCYLCCSQDRRLEHTKSTTALFTCVGYSTWRPRDACYVKATSSLHSVSLILLLVLLLFKIAAVVFIVFIYVVPNLLPCGLSA